MTATAKPKRLWEVDHPYYMTAGNYFKAGMHTEWESLEDYLAEFGETDIDRNLVIRWDWREGEGWELPEYSGSDTDKIGRLMIQMIGQRKALLHSHEVAVCRNDESAAREYLSHHAERIAQNWEPLSLTF
ncbi:MAG: hypothetical protein ABJG14_21870 [Sulfitobacter sp.]|uniref:hypothetical protein n=1 Tax=Alphaproteobacteria TaxID=28211 RepID=UPI0032655B32